MVQFAPADVFDDETPAADPRGEAPVAAPRRRSRRLAAPRCAPTNPLLEQAFPSWARPPKQPAVGAERASRRRSAPAPASPCWIKFFASIRRSPARCASAWRLRAATACAALARHREDSSALRDAEHLSPGAGGSAIPARPGESIGCGAVSPRARRGSSAETLRRAADLLDLPRAPRFQAFAGALRDILCRRRKSARGGGARGSRRWNV